MRRRILKRILPPGSRRDRLAWMAWLTVRKMREGPVPWFRAVRRGVFQMLPPGAQARVLRWTGRSRAVVGAEVSHGSADAVSEPGLVSVVLPVFNQAHMVGGAIESVLAQTRARLELIVVDDGSDDGVETVLARYLGDPRVRVVTQPNQGLPKALSNGFELATGEFWTWTSADNLMLPQQLDRLVARLEQDPGLAMVYADYEIIDADGQPVYGTDFRVPDRSGPDSADIHLPRQTAALNVVQDNFIGPCFLYRAEVGRLVGDYAPEMGLEDYDYWMRVNRLFRIEHLGTDELLYRYRVHDDSLSGRARQLRIQERGIELLEHERERAAWVDAPWRVVADEPSREWLTPLVDASDELTALGECDLGDDRKTLLVLAAEGLESRSVDDLPAGAAVAVWFERVEDVYRHHAALAGARIAVFAASPDVAARLAVFTRAVFLVEPGAGLLALARRFAANATFFHRALSPDRLQRCVPVPQRSEQPLRVLLQADAFTQGGLERVVLDLASCLRDGDVELSLLVLGQQGNDAAAMRELGVSVHDLGSRPDPRAYGELLKDRRIDVVNAHDSVFGAEVATDLGVPFVQTIHNTYVWLEPEPIAAYRAADPHTAAYVCVSAQALCYSDLRLLLDVGKSVVIPNGIDSSCSSGGEWRGGDHPLRAELDLGRDDFVFVNVAAVYPPKAQRVAVRALAQVLAEAPGARIVFLGRDADPAYARLVRKEAEDLGVDHAIVWAGYRSDSRPFYSMADALLLPSYWEGCSLAVLEALSAGLPLVLSDVGAAREQLRLGRGELVPPPYRSIAELDWTNVGKWLNGISDDFVDAVATAMLRVVRSGAAPATTRDVQAFDRRRMAQDYERLFRWLGQGGRPAAVRSWLRRSAGVTVRQQ